MANSPVRACVVALTAVAAVCVANLAAAQEPAILAPADAVVTGFSGVIAPDAELPAEIPALDETFINPDGVSARIISLAAPGHVWDARVWPAEVARDILARDVGQVFGVAIDGEEKPNIYLAASSAYGLQLVGPDADADGRPERLKKGQADAAFMAGQWGARDAAGGPGSIWKVDGATGAITLFATVTDGGAANPGPGIGNIYYDTARKELFASDLSTGLIHRFDALGQLIETYDHGETGRAAHGLPPRADDPAGRLVITSKDFDIEDPETWGYAHEDRRVWALTMGGSRLYYSVVGENQIWSVGFDKETGRFARDGRWELDVPKKPKDLPVTDMLVTSRGAMILAQRGAPSSIHDYANFAEAGKSRTYRFWLENPDDPKTPSRWIAEPEEYAVGFEPDNRFSDGGLALNYGYTKQGVIDRDQCEASLWTTGDNLRAIEEAVVKAALQPGGAFFVDGLQGMPLGPVKPENTPPWASYMVDADTGNTDAPDSGDALPWSDTAVTGWMGDVAIYKPCGGAGGAGGVGGDGGGGGGDGGGGGWTDVWYPPYPACIPGYDCPVDPGCAGDSCEPPPSCLKPAGGFACDGSTGTWVYELAANADHALNADRVKIAHTTPGVSITGAPVLAYSAPATRLEITGLSPGQLMTMDLCLFEEAAMQSGKPFDCCKATITLKAPKQACEKKP